MIFSVAILAIVLSDTWLLTLAILCAFSDTVTGHLRAGAAYMSVR
jgi:hypothetical protein